LNYKAKINPPIRDQGSSRWFLRFILDVRKVILKLLAEEEAKDFAPLSKQK
jgi:hypothetical protein